MDFHELEAFIVLAHTLHFAKAATIIHTSPSALSRILTRLEEELGAQLLERDTRRVALTEQGMAFLVFAEESIHNRDEIRDSFDTINGELRGTLRVYASVTACYSILPPFVSALGKAHPGIKLSVETGDPADAEHFVREGNVDIALAALPDGGFPGLESISVKRTPLVFISSHNGKWHDIARHLEGSGPLNALSKTPLILPRYGLARERFDRWARAHQVRPIVAAEASGNEAILALARLGIGLGLVPRLVLENSPFAEGLVLQHANMTFGDYDIGFVLPPLKSGSAHSLALRKEVTAILSRVYTAMSMGPETEPLV